MTNDFHKAQGLLNVTTVDGVIMAEKWPALPIRNLLVSGRALYLRVFYSNGQVMSMLQDGFKSDLLPPSKWSLDLSWWCTFTFIRHPIERFLLAYSEVEEGLSGSVLHLCTYIHSAFYLPTYSTSSYLPMNLRLRIGQMRISLRSFSSYTARKGASR